MFQSQQFIKSKFYVKEMPKKRPTIITNYVEANKNEEQFNENLILKLKNSQREIEEFENFLSKVEDDPKNNE